MFYLAVATKMCTYSGVSKTGLKLCDDISFWLSKINLQKKLIALHGVKSFSAFTYTQQSD